ncbi:MAG TPA: hypothetical protein VMU03_08105 [Gammaproteobacteria bacterium]|nr:hypothetical protein [Gammaproteobacteria bacterium]
MSGMSAVFKKLNLMDQTEIAVVNAPVSFEPEIATLRGVTVRRALAIGAPLKFSLAFVTTQPEVNVLANGVAECTVGDAVVWFAYPKQSSKRYTSEIDRDRGWAALGAAGFEPVRMVAIDEDWSAVRFRRAGFIKTLNRPKEYALSAAGRAKAGAAKAGARKKKVAKRKARRAKKK